MSLLACFPAPRPLDLRGARYLATELQLRHLAELEAVALTLRGEPDSFAALLDDQGDPPAYRQRLRDLYDTLEAGGGAACAWGSAECAELVMGTVAGLSAYLALVLRSHTPALSPSTVEALVLALTDAEWRAVDRLALALDPLDEVGHLIDREAGARLPTGGDAPGPTWPEAIAETCRFANVLPSSVGEMHLGQFRLLRTGGKAPSRDVDKPKGWSMDRFKDEFLSKRRRFWNETAEADRAALAARAGTVADPVAAEAPALDSIHGDS